MIKTLFKILLVFVLCLSPLLGLAASAQAQEPVSTPTPTSVLMQEPPLANSDPNVVTFEQLKRGEIQLTGPYSRFSFAFALPADWRLLPGTQLNLLMGVSFSTPVLTQFNYPIGWGGGTLSVFLNGTLIDVLALSEVGEVEGNIQIPLDAFVSDRLDERMVLGFILDSSDFCYVNDHFNIIIHNNSQFILPHELIQPDTNLVKFPRPIYQDSFKEDSAMVIIPDQPSAAELQAALTVVAGLGNLSSNTIALDITKLSQLSPDLVTDKHLIFVGKAPSLPALNDLRLPLPVSGSEFQIADGNSDDGVIQMIVSPWSNAHVVLVVSGNTDEGTVKAAQAISTGVLRPNRSPNLAIVEEVQPNTILTPGPIDTTLTDLGYSDEIFDSIGSNSNDYTFYIPPGMTTGPDAYFELTFGHSAILNYDRSAITILINSRPIGSVRMDAASAGKAKNKVRVEIPASTIRPGRNYLTVRAELVPVDVCAYLNSEGFWLSIWPESVLHLPLEPAIHNPVSDLDLGSFPAPFSYDPTLNNTAFLLPRDDLNAWRSAAQIASYLGYRAGGPITKLSVFYGDDLPGAEREKYNLLLVGRPTQLPIINDVNAALPAPFSQGNDVASEANFQVTFRIPPDSPLGYVELLPSPWNTENVVLATLGNSPQGVNWATSSLFDPKISPRLAGNFAVVNDQQVLTTDTRSAVSITSEISTPAPEADALLPVGAPASTAARPGWILPVLLITFTLIILVLAFVIIGNVKRNRSR
jgi:hypothetical protein